MTEFNWNDGPYELVRDDKIYKNVKFEPSPYGSGLINILDQDGTYITNVHKHSGNAFLHLEAAEAYKREGRDGIEYTRSVYVRKMVDEFDGMEDTEVAELLRKTDLLANKLTALLYKRGYTIFDTDGDEIHESWQRLTDADKYQKIGKITKTETVVVKKEI